MTTSALVTRGTYRALQDHVEMVKKVHLRDLFRSDPSRGSRLTVEAAGLFLDYSKNRVTTATMELLFRLAEDCGFALQRDAMFRGEIVNLSEHRPALHVALRMPSSESLIIDGVDVVRLVHGELLKMALISREIRSGLKTGHTGRRIRNIVNIGIGGSHLGPVMVYEALRDFADRDLTFSFVSSIDASDFFDATAAFDPEETLFIVASKTFSTHETLANAELARQWIIDHYGTEDAIGAHFIAVTDNADAACAFGVQRDHLFEMWNWVGGRYSIGSAVGLSAMMAIGPERFAELLIGFYDMDTHFRHAPMRQNMPVILGLLTTFYTQFFGAQSIGVMPYSYRLRNLPSYLQQLTMESNGKSVTADGRIVDYMTGPIYWGEMGTNGQHSFFQLLHQGTPLVPLDLIGFVNDAKSDNQHHGILMANLLAQAEALAFGRTREELHREDVSETLVPYKVMEGNRPTNVLLADRLTPRTLGALVALYEHSVFTQGAVLGVNSFDQWGVEFGKDLAERIIPELGSSHLPENAHDSSTNALIARYRALRRWD